MIQGAPFAQVKDMVMDESGVTEELDELKEFAETDNDEAKTKAENIKVRTYIFYNYIVSNINCLSSPCASGSTKKQNLRL